MIFFNKSKISIFLFSFFLSFKISLNAILVGYYPGWGQWEGSSFDQVRSIVPEFTHVNYAFLEPYPDGRVVTVDPDTDIQQNLLRTISGTVNNPGISYGGWIINNNDSRPIEFLPPPESIKGYPDKFPANIFSQVGANPKVEIETRKNLAKNIAKVNKYYGYKVIDIDWEYPGYPAMQQGNPADFGNFLELLKEIYNEAHKSENNMEVSIAGPSQWGLILPKLNLGQLQNYLDWINIMAYDFVGYNWVQHTGHQAALRQSGDFDNKDYYIEKIVQTYLDSGVPANKLVLGVPTYGRSFGNVQAGPKNDGLFQTFSGAGPSSSNTKDIGLVLPNDLRNLNPKFIFWDEKAQAPYYYGPFGGQQNVFITFDNEESLYRKGQFIRQKGLKGAMVWDIRPGIDQLIKALKDGMNGIARADIESRRNEREESAKK